MAQPRVSRRAWFAAAPLLPLALAAGCQTPSGDTLDLGALESVRFEGFSPEAIADAVTRQFEARGFEIGPRADRELVFDRPGTRRDNLRYGGWFPEDTWLRVRVRLRETGGHFVEARSDPFLVRGRDSMTVDAQPLNRGRMKEFGGLLAAAQRALEAGDL
jgi:hypothetical protein